MVRDVCLARLAMALIRTTAAHVAQGNTFTKDNVLHSVMKALTLTQLLSSAHSVTKIVLSATAHHRKSVVCVQQARSLQAVLACTNVHREHFSIKKAALANVATQAAQNI